MQKIIIGTRGSELALTQTKMVVATLGDVETEIKIIKTTGDLDQSTSLKEIGGKEVFTREIDKALLDGEVDIAVHSLKDVPGIIDDNITIAATLPREDARDSLIGATSIEDLPQAASIGTSSPRRSAQLLKIRPDLNIKEIRGNVPTRIKKVEDKEFDATILAMAGLKRLELNDYLNPISTDLMLPAAGQAIIGIAALKTNSEAIQILEKINYEETYICATAERAAIKAFGGDCHSPIAAYCEIQNEQIKLKGFYANKDGSNIIEIERSGSKNEAENLGKEIGLYLKGQSEK